MGPINYYAGVAFFSFVIAAGRALLKGSPWGLRASAISQVLQVVSFAFLGGPQLRIQAGPLLGIKVSSNYAVFTAGFYSSFFLGTRVAGPAFEVTVNILAAIWATYLMRAWLRDRRATGQAAA
jgi:hypothetical protein